MDSDTKFTPEEEAKGNVVVLDKTINHKDDGSITFICRKPTGTEQYLLWTSHNTQFVSNQDIIRAGYCHGQRERKAREEENTTYTKNTASVSNGPLAMESNKSREENKRSKKWKTHAHTDKLRIATEVQ